MQTACNSIRQKVSDKSRSVIKDISLCDCDAASALTESMLQQHTEIFGGSKEGAPFDKDSVTSKRTVEVTMLDRPQQLPHIDFAFGKFVLVFLVLPSSMVSKKKPTGSTSIVSGTVNPRALCTLSTLTIVHL